MFGSFHVYCFRSLQDPHNRRVNRALLAGRAERDALIERICKLKKGFNHFCIIKTEFYKS